MSSSSNVIKIWQSKHDQLTETNLSEFIQFAKSELNIYEEQGWEASSWKPSKGQTLVFGFRAVSGNNYSEIITFRGRYLEFVKAFIRQQMTIKELTSSHLWITMFRNLYKALIDKNSVKEPCISDVNGQTLRDTICLIKQSESNLTRRYQIGGKLEKLVNWLLKESIILTLPVFKNPFPKQVNKAEQLGVEADAFRSSRCPTMHEMLSLAECFSKAETLQDKYFTSACVMLCFAPARINELDGLTIHSLQQGDDEGWYVVWKGSKGHNDHPKPVPPLMLDVVQKAFNQLIEISKPARMCAKWAYEHPNEFYKHGGCITPTFHKEEQSLSHRQIAHAMDVTGSLHHTDIEKFNTPTKWINNLIQEKNVSYARLNELVHEKYKKKNWPNNPSSNRPIWERFDLKQEDGTPIALTTHQFRVWLNTHAKLGGVDDWKIAQWSGRADPQQNSAYDLRTLEQKNSLANELMVKSYDESPSAVTLKQNNLPVPLKSVGVDREDVADFTGIGFCTHNFAQTPCTKAGECVTCKDHVCLKGMPETLDELEHLEMLISERFDKSTQAMDKGVFGADRWVTHLGWKLGHIRTLIKIMKDDRVSDGTIIKIPVEHDPSPTRRALEDKNMATNLNNDGTDSSNSSSSIKVEMNKLLGF